MAVMSPAMVVVSLLCLSYKCLKCAQRLVGELKVIEVPLSCGRVCHRTSLYHYKVSTVL